jgi:phage protein D
MKFVRQPRQVLRPITGRRLSAARRALQRQADEVALFPELQPTETPEQRIARLDADAQAHLQRIRDHTAATWRRARRALRTLTPAQFAQVMARWHCPHWHPPHEAHYLADLIHTATRP